MPYRTGLNPVAEWMMVGMTAAMLLTKEEPVTSERLLKIAGVAVTGMVAGLMMKIFGDKTGPRKW